MKKAIVVGSGAGGATAAKELQGKFDVTVLEAGRDFRRFRLKLPVVEKLKKAGLLFDEREVGLLFPCMKVRKATDGMILINGVGLGGTTTISTGNALRMDKDLKELGIDLDKEFEELYGEIPVTTSHQRLWRETTRRLFEISNEMGLAPTPTPKMGEYERCKRCGRCILGCPNNVKWDSRRFLDKAKAGGARLVTDATATKVVIDSGRATGLQVRIGWRRMFVPADLVILAAGGLGTPVILENSGVRCEQKLFVDPVLCVASVRSQCRQNEEIPMPFVIQKERYILAPYFDHLSFFFNKQWKYPAEHTLAIMVKLADENQGGIDSGRIQKRLTDDDRKQLAEGVEICHELLRRMGAAEKNIFLGTLNAGHPGGMLPLTKKEAVTFHNDRLPDNLYIADATLFPNSLGNPPIFTIMAMAKRVSRLCAERFSGN